MCKCRARAGARSGLRCSRPLFQTRLYLPLPWGRTFRRTWRSPRPRHLCLPAHQEGRYKATLIDSERYLLTCYRYIELNPVRANLVTNPCAYRWFGYGANAEGGSDSLITSHVQYQALGVDAQARQRAYRALFQVHVDTCTLGEIREASNKGWALGSERFRSEIEQLLKRRTRPLPKSGDHRSQVFRARRVSGS